MVALWVGSPLWFVGLTGSGDSCLDYTNTTRWVGQMGFIRRGSRGAATDVCVLSTRAGMDTGGPRRRRRSAALHAVRSGGSGRTRGPFRVHCRMAVAIRLTGVRSTSGRSGSFALVGRPDAGVEAQRRSLPAKLLTLFFIRGTSARASPGRPMRWADGGASAVA
jgi:hypothetical protein